MRTDCARCPHTPAPGPYGLARHATMRGVTLIELLTVIVVIAILATMAVSTYRKYLIRTNRTDATTSLLRVQVAEEKYFLQNNQYTDSLAALGLVSTSAQGYYTLSIAAGDTTLATSFKATATPSGAQASQDSDCQTLTIDDKGVRGSTPGAASTCWK